jgi:hypothetical protein
VINDKGGLECVLKTLSMEEAGRTVLRIVPVEAEVVVVDSWAGQ